MNHSTLTTKESIDNRLIEEISQLQQFSLGEGAAVCEVCGDKLREGAPIVVFVFRPADQTAFQVGHVKCVDCRHEPTEYFTLGVRGSCWRVVSARAVILRPSHRGKYYWLHSRAL